MRNLDFTLGLKISLAAKSPVGVKIFVPRASEQRERRRGGAGGAGAPLGQLPPPHRVVEQSAQLPRPEDRDHAEVRRRGGSLSILSIIKI